ncbi:hypothetical protein M413DRAFT_33112 [Hebeloma cylindrosporum]|uniref:Uncharacterized protein n=1 Tax=Hebeloma cylindrosporum TaxID=76867 RepID=A0A0C3BRJ5_HEBCY|nr:hypothetical protein M413DRAFT_33112 [Hebeloma cylindrosporum h7]
MFSLIFINAKIANYRQLQRLLTYHKLLSAFYFPRRADTLSPAEATVYMKPPLPVLYPNWSVAPSTPNKHPADLAINLYLRFLTTHMKTVP